MGLMITRRLRPGATAAACLATAVLAGCTSSGDGGPSATPPASSSPSGTPTTSSSTSTAGTGAPGSSGLAALDGAYLLAGSEPEAALLYRVAGGRLVPAVAARGISTVAAGDDAVVVGRDTGSAETVEQLRGGALRSIGLRSGFAPALSGDGALAYAVLGASTTPGISKPGGVSIRVRESLTGRDRTVTTLPADLSVLGLAWSDDDLVAMIDDGERARLLAYPDGRGPAKGLVPPTITTAADTAVITGGDGVVATSSNDARVPAQVYSLPSARPRDIAVGWQPVCFADDDTLLVSRGARLASVAVPRSAELGAPRVLGTAPAPIQGGACD